MPFIQPPDLSSSSDTIEADELVDSIGANATAGNNLEVEVARLSQRVAALEGTNPVDIAPNSNKVSNITALSDAIAGGNVDRINGTNVSPSGPYGGYQLHTGGPYYILNQTLKAVERAISIENDQEISSLTIAGSDFTTTTVCMYMGFVQNLHIYQTTFFVTEEPNNFATRGTVSYIEALYSTWDNTSFSNRAVIRLYGVSGGLFYHCTFLGGSLILGGTSSSEPSPDVPIELFANVLYDGCIHNFTNDEDQTAMEIWSNTHHVTFRNCFFTLTGNNASNLATFHPAYPELGAPGAHDIIFDNCHIRYSSSDPFVNVTHAHMNYDTPAYPSAHNIIITP